LDRQERAAQAIVRLRSDSWQKRGETHERRGLCFQIPD
jgi:hypothetical protein